MTKAEIKIALETKFDKVGTWLGGFPIQLDMARYDIVVFTFGKGFATYTIFVEDDNGPGESATFGGKDPTAEPVESPPDFTQKVLDEIQSRVDSAQIEGGLVNKSGNKVAEVTIYTLSGQDVTSENYVVYEKPDETLGFRKIV